MSEVLSQRDIDQLLSAIAGDDLEEEIKPSAIEKIRIYDFKRPDVISYTEAEKLSKSLRRIELEEIDLYSIDRFHMKDFIHWQCHGKDRFRLFGTPSNTYWISIPAIRIMDDCLERDIRRLLEVLTKEKVNNFVEAKGTKKDFKNLTSEDYVETTSGVLLTYLAGKDKTQEVEIFVTKKVIDDFLERGSAPEPNLQNGIPITAVLGNTVLPFDKASELKEGSFFKLDKIAGMPIDLFVGTNKIAEAEVIVQGDYFGVRII